MQTKLFIHRNTYDSITPRAIQNDDYFSLRKLNNSKLKRLTWFNLYVKYNEISEFEF